jgi:hypothetical protein
VVSRDQSRAAITVSMNAVGAGSYSRGLPIRAAIFESGRFDKIQPTPATLQVNDGDTAATMIAEGVAPPYFGRRHVSLCDKGTRSDDADPVSARWRCGVVSARAYMLMMPYFVIDATQRSTDHFSLHRGQ